MLKRGAEEAAPDEPAAKAPMKGGAGGMRADSVVNPIPRLFKTQSITLNFSQRTWEEIGPNQLLYLPTSINPKFMFDQSHWNLLNRYKELWSTMEIHHPSVRISNLIMLQDEIKTESGTPRDVTAYTQACYMLKYTPNRILNWFSLGTTNDCGKTQSLLNVNLGYCSECKMMSQLKNVNGYENFENLVINPAKPNVLGGYKDVYPTAKVINDGNAVTNYMYVKDNYFNPYDGNPFAPFSVNWKGEDPYIPMNTHPTFARNYDKIELFKYGDVIDFDINTNLEGLKLINSTYNSMLQHTHDVNISKLHDLPSGSGNHKFEVITDFIYPGRNRPYFSRYDNLNHVAASEHAKSLGQLKHHFFTMPPIKKNDGSLIKQRCSFLLEQKCSITLHFPESTSDQESLINMLNQSDAVLLRPGVWAIHQKDSKTPDKPDPPPDKITEEKIREDFKKYVEDTLASTRTYVETENWLLLKYLHSIIGTCISPIPPIPSPKKDSDYQKPVDFFSTIPTFSLRELFIFKNGTDFQKELMFGYLVFTFLTQLLRQKDLINARMSLKYQQTHTEKEKGNNNVYISYPLKKIVENTANMYYNDDQCNALLIRYLPSKELYGSYYGTYNRNIQDRDKNDYNLEQQRQLQFGDVKELKFYAMEWFAFLQHMGIMLLPAQDIFVNYILSKENKMYISDNVCDKDYDVVNETDGANWNKRTNIFYV